MEPIVERVNDIPSQLGGEGPNWHSETQSLYFVDAIDKTINKYVPSTGQYTNAKLETQPSMIIPVKDKKNQFVVDTEKDVCIVTWDGVSDKVSKTEKIADLEQDAGKNTMDDVGQDPKGGLWKGNRKQIFTQRKNYNRGTPDDTTDDEDDDDSWVMVFNGDSVLNKGTISQTVEPPTNKDAAAPAIPKIYEMRVDTNVSNRFAKTVITSKVRNLNSKAQEITFSVVTPDKSFISGFIMEIDGKKYEAYVKEKEEAKHVYDQAVAFGRAAAHVAVSARDSNRFTVSVNVEQQSEVIFYLSYEELLERKQEMYEVVLNIHPGQPVEHLEVQVKIEESRPLKFVKAPSLRSGNEISKNKPDIDPEADIKNINETSAIVTFKPDIIKQKLFAISMGGREDDGLSGQFVVQYDVDRDPQGGEVLVDGGYFVHFFAPDELPQLKKQVVFVLDTSGSMSGIRIIQLKEAMNSILDELNSEDIFSIVEFNSVTNVWNILGVKVTYQVGEDSPYSRKPKTKLEQVIPPSVEATEKHIMKAKTVIQKLGANGGTNIQSALKIGLEIVSRNKDPKVHQPIIVFLTDGEPTVGQCDTDAITTEITKLNANKVPIFSLSFGDEADREFLQKLSLKNQGFARHIYEAADANLQLEDFYKQISSPLLSNVTFKYVDKVKNVTRTHFPILFGGGELYITGIITDPDFEPPLVEGCGVFGLIQLKPKVYQAAGSLERLWAYLTVKQLLEQRDVAEDKEALTREALALALKYSFVTDVSSLVVVKPDASTSAVNTEDASKNDRYSDADSYGNFLCSEDVYCDEMPSFHELPSRAHNRYRALDDAVLITESSPCHIGFSYVFGPNDIRNASKKALLDDAALVAGASLCRMDCSYDSRNASQKACRMRKKSGLMSMFAASSVAACRSLVKTIKWKPSSRSSTSSDKDSMSLDAGTDDNNSIDGGSSQDNKKISSYVTEIVCSNGLAWNKELQQFYYADTMKGTIDAFDYDIGKGTVSNCREIFTLAKHNIKGYANGMAIDVDGNLWVAIFGGDCVIKIDPRKPETLLQKIDIPVSQVTSVAWGGKDLNILYVTTGNIPIDGQELQPPNDGAVFKVTGLGTRGAASI